LIEIRGFPAGVPVACEREIPVPRYPQYAPLRHKDVGRRQLADAAIDSGRRWNVEKCQVRVDGVRLPVAGHVGIFEERLQFGAEHDATIRERGVVERFDAEPIAREQQPAVRGVPDREREHAAKPVDAALAPLLVAVNDDLGVRACLEPVTARDEVRANLREVVNLAVEDRPHRAVFVRQWLIAGREIDDAQTPVSETDPGAHVMSGGIGAAVRHHVGHRFEHVAIDGAQRVVVESSGDTAHG